MGIRLNWRRRWVVVAVATLTLLMLPTAALGAPPANDDFDTAAVVSGLPFTDVRDTSEATWAFDDPDICHSNGSVWYSYTPTTDMLLAADTFGSDFDTVLSAYTGTRGALSQVPNACNDDYQTFTSRVTFPAQAGTTYHFLVGFCCGSGSDGGGRLTFNLQEVVAPPSDNFADAIPVTALPFNDTVDTSGSSLEVGEPLPSCTGDLTGSIWWEWEAGTAGSFSANTGGAFSTAVAVYTGDSVDALAEVACGAFGQLATFGADLGVTYHFQVGGLYNGEGPVQFSLDEAPAPEANFGFWPDDPFAYEWISFYDNTWDPAGVGIATHEWDFGDGTGDTACCPQHRYTADGEYTVHLAVTTFDGRSASATGVVTVETHDVAITKFKVPTSAREGQTRTITVGVSNTRLPEQVRVDLYRSVPGQSWFEWIGASTQEVNVRSGNRTTDYHFNYTFTADDALFGKVTFLATANLESARDAAPADNELSAPPTRVR